MSLLSRSDRMSTGVPGCDEILDGGLITGRCYLIGGEAGAGKTIFSLQWLRAGQANGETCMYITLCERASEINRNVAGFGWNLDGIDIVDLSPSGADLADGVGEYRIFPPSEVERGSLWKAIHGVP